METQIITEGETKLEVPKLKEYQTSPNEYVPSLTPVFFNPLMELSRDISTTFLQVLTKELGKPRVCDALAGVGARGLRYANEVKGTSETIINDKSQKAVELIRKNVKHNELSSVTVKNEDANVLLQKHKSRFHVVDLDPFGSPAPFLSSACSALSHHSALLVTATDTAPLCGAHPKACQRKYGARSLRTPYCHELGLRILIGFCQRVGARRDLALYPVFCHSTQHYLRIHLRAEEGARKADSILEEQGYVSHCFNCGRRIITPGPLASLPHECECGRKLEHSGPLWIGKLFDREFVKLMIKELSKKNFKQNHEEQKLLRLCLNESDGPPTYYDLHKISSQTGAPPPKINRVINQLKKQEYLASRTHFSNTGIRTNAPIEKLQKIISKN